MRAAASGTVAFALALFVATTAVADERAAELVALPEPARLGRLVSPAPGSQMPLVIILPDALGEDGRSEPYVDSLLARGIATLVLGLGDDLETAPSPVEPAASPAAAALALAWAADAGFAAARIGLLGFGLGGRAAMATEAGLPVAALYPGCTDLPPRAAAPALVLQGGERARDCDVVAARGDVTVQVLHGAGHAWDALGAIWPSLGPVLPDPAGGGLLRAQTSLDATLAAAEAVADWFTTYLLTPQRSAAR